MKKTYLLILVLFVLVFGYSQDTPVLKVANKPLGLSSLDIKVEVVGNIATTTYDMLFYNPTQSVLEGELSFPLGEGHNVSRFALDVNGKLREAVVVEKELGRIAFEDVVRRGVDPALLEKGTGNNYKARIYPIPAKGHKRVLLAYEQELVLDNKAHYYNLPLNFKNAIEDFTLEITVFEQVTQPVIERGQISGLEFANWKKNYVTKINKKGYIPNKNITIKIPVPPGTEKVLVSDHHFYVYKTISPQKRLRSIPHSITILWDTSFSMKDKDLTKELKFLDAYFSDIKNVDVRFISFSNTKQSSIDFVIKNGKWDAIKQKIDGLIYDGGTSYDLFSQEKEDSDAILLFSDGMASLSKIKLESKKPVFIVNSILKSNHVALKSIAEKTNGAYINLKTRSVTDAISRIKYNAYKFLGYSSKSKSLEIYPKGPITVTNEFSLVGKKNKTGEILVLNFGYGKEITQKISVKLNGSQKTNSRVRRIWAQKKLDNLESNSKDNKDLITSLGKEYSLVTDYTSLIVLENIEDYIKYEITPPKELLEEYNRILAQKESNTKRKSIAMNRAMQEASRASRNQNSAEARSVRNREQPLITQEFKIANDENPPSPPALMRTPELLEEEVIELEEIVDLQEIEDVEEMNLGFEDVSQIPFSSIEFTPIFPECEQGSEQERKTCFSQKVRTFITQNFNKQITHDLGLSGRQRVYVRFIIDSLGEIKDVKARGPHSALEEEAIRVIRLLPKMTPGNQRGKPVSVSYTIPIVFDINDQGDFTYNNTTNSENPNTDQLTSKPNQYIGDLVVKDRNVVTEYLTALRNVKNKTKAYQLYLTQREKYLKTPAYFIDVSNFFRIEHQDEAYAYRILSNIPEIDFDNYELLKVFGYQLQMNNEYSLSTFIFKRILELRPEDSQSYRDLAIAYQNNGKCQEALDLLYSIISGEIYKDSKRRVFKSIEAIAKNEIKTLIQHNREDLDLSKIDEKLLASVSFDIRITTDWNHNDTDIDLHIIDPNLEECYYKNRKTRIGGRMSKDMTEGFGPEEFTLKDAIKGTYYIKIKYFGDRYQKVVNPTFMKVTIFKRYGTKKEMKETRVIRLTKNDEEEIIAKLVF